MKNVVAEVTFQFWAILTNFGQILAIFWTFLYYCARLPQHPYFPYCAMQVPIVIVSLFSHRVTSSSDQSNLCHPTFHDSSLLFFQILQVLQRPQAMGFIKLIKETMYFWLVLEKEIRSQRLLGPET